MATGIPLAKTVAEGGKTFYEDTAGGRFKFGKAEDVVYYVTKGDGLCYDIAEPPPPLPAAISVGKHTRSAIAHTCDLQRRRTRGTTNWPWTVEGEETNASPKKREYR